MAFYQPAIRYEVTFNDNGSKRVTFGKKMAPCLRRGPAVELLPLQALQQGAGERIPVALPKLLQLRGHCQAKSGNFVDPHCRKSLQWLDIPVFTCPVPDLRQCALREFLRRALLQRHECREQHRRDLVERDRGGTRQFAQFVAVRVRNDGDMHIRRRAKAENTLQPDLARG